MSKFFDDIGGLMQDCSIFNVNALEILQSCTKPSIYDQNALIFSTHWNLAIISFR